MEYRKLDDDERKVTERNLKSHETELKYLKLELDRLNFELEKGLDLKFYYMTKAAEMNKRKIVQDIAETEMAVNVSKEQLEKGVSVKEDKKEVE